MTQPKIAVLDDYAGTSRPYFSKLTQNQKEHDLVVDYFEDTLNTRTPEGLRLAIQRYNDYEIISTMRERTPFPAELVSQLPKLKLLLTTGNKNASIDMEECTRRGVAVTGTGRWAQFDPNHDSTNEQCWALILAVARRIAELDARVKTGRGKEGWQHGLNTGLAGKTLGLLGLGRLGTQAAATGMLGFGMKVLAWSENLTQEKADAAAEKRGLPAGSFQVAKDKEDLFRNADVLSIHYVLSERSRGIVGKKELQMMKSSAFIVNTSRGPLIDENALIQALKQSEIHGVGLDVFDTEPLPDDSAWRKTGWPEDVVVVISPHMGYVEETTMTSWYEQTTENIGLWLTGKNVLHQINT